MVRSRYQPVDRPCRGKARSNIVARHSPQPVTSAMEAFAARPGAEEVDGTKAEGPRAAAEVKRSTIPAAATEPGRGKTPPSGDDGGGTGTCDCGGVQVAAAVWTTSNVDAANERATTRTGALTRSAPPVRAKGTLSICTEQRITQRAQQSACYRTPTSTATFGCRPS